MKTLVRHMVTFAFTPRLNMFDVLVLMNVVGPLFSFLLLKFGVLGACIALVSLCTLLSVFSMFMEYLVEHWGRE